MKFVDDLSIALTLNINGKAFTVPGGSVKLLELDLHSWGFSGQIGFVISSEHSQDTLLTPITANDLIEITLVIGVYIKSSDAKSNTLKLSGLVTTRQISEQTLSNVLPTQDLMLYRYYSLTFADPAAVLWKQHYPCDLYTDATLQTLISAHVSTKINIKYDWDVLETEHAVLSLPLGASDNTASFYDYLIWLVDSQNGVFTYSASANTYTLSASKTSSSKTQALDSLEVLGYRVELPQVARFQPNVLNAYAEDAQSSSVENKQTAKPMRHDFIARYPIAADMQARVTLETARFKQRLHEVHVEYKKFPLMISLPGESVKFEGSGWSSSLYVKGKSYRVRDWSLRAYSIDENMTAELDMPYSRYEMEHEIKLECGSELWVDLPKYAAPVYPFFVEGKVVSEQGEDEETTYEFYQDEDTSETYYQVSIPLWESKKVRAAFEPNLLSGQFYFPYYKNARVLIGLGFDSAHIAGFLDWSSGTAQTMDSQGNQLVMGKSTTNQTILKHSYVDSKPELQIQRTMDKDKELIKFSEGYILLRTQQEEEEG
ncbi:hypothetical protein F6R98_00375 [Candidatus Methylospira mobilis]|uniref:Uncharacterized protein n=1 Tax=Candidatus Methylospira mobilis TaxID=1808979 RepID=A0A5Q0BHG1_9GAMM|nr:hypothetical protein [Candidatus Methylospira mobilis]QFY41256.1 hypothetical protein F6R98_00375 [Candidatus Methylospira mobilis]WNV05522.1 hypothetical protein RP726_03670 [Candidatus Methylospira mobilis]